jgi:hypothetical protein
MAVGIIREAMTDLEDGADCLFTGKDGRYLNSHLVTRAIGRARMAGRSPIANWSAPDLRRTALTGMARAVSDFGSYQCEHIGTVYSDEVIESGVGTTSGIGGCC